VSTLQEVIDKSDILNAERLRIIDLMLGTNGKKPTQSERDKLDKQLAEVIKQLTELDAEYPRLTNGDVRIDRKTNKIFLRYKKP